MMRLLRVFPGAKGNEGEQVTTPMWLHYEECASSFCHGPVQGNCWGVMHKAGAGIENTPVTNIGYTTAMKRFSGYALNR